MCLVPAFVLVVGLALGAGASAADPAEGVWVTEPDRKDLISHIEIRSCGDRLCGRILAAYDRSGAAVTTPNIGRELFWDVSPLGGGRYGNGTVWLPLIDVTARASMELIGRDTMRVTGCRAGICGGQVWRRTR